MSRILIVEDEPDVREMTCFALAQAGYDCIEAESAEEAREIILNGSDSLLILMDWMLPGESGVELTRDLKENPATRMIPIIMLTARGEEDDKVKGLESGADDYITKPFSPRELTARIKALLRRSMPHQTDEVVHAGHLSLDPASYRVTFADDTIELGPTEFRLLHFFMTHPDKVYSRSKLLDRVWGTNVYVEERTVDVHIRRLRKALEPHDAAAMVQTVRGAGYRFSEKPKGA